MIEVDKVSFGYGKSRILKRISFSVKQGEIASLIGASGSGKTTLFRLLTGLLLPTEGSVVIAKDLLPYGASHVTYMMQEDLLLPWRTVQKNMLLTSELGQRRRLTLESEEEAQILLKEMGLDECAQMFPNQLSGGMRQRVALARSLLQKRPVLLLDEPFGALDVNLREQMYSLLRSAQRKYGTTILMITHDFRDALSLSDRILFLDKGIVKKEWHVPSGIRYEPASMGLLNEELRAALVEG